MFDVFIISPYTAGNISIESERARDADLYVAELAREGIVAYSTISAMHHLLTICDLPGTWVFWKNHCTKMIRSAKEVHVLELEGWEESEGVAAELEIAAKYNKPVIFISRGIKDV